MVFPYSCVAAIYVTSSPTMVTYLGPQGRLFKASEKTWGKEICVRSVDNGKTNYGKSHSRLAGGQHNNQLQADC